MSAFDPKQTFSIASFEPLETPLLKRADERVDTVMARQKSGTARIARDARAPVGHRLCASDGSVSLR
jgi:hypothetical protein